MLDEVPVLDDIRYRLYCIIVSAEYLCGQYIDLLPYAGEQAATNTFSMIASKVREGIPDGSVILDMAFLTLQCCTVVGKLLLESKP